MKVRGKDPQDQMRREKKRFENKQKCQTKITKEEGQKNTKLDQF